ncbi:cell division protein CrgA [Streptomonospora litoralis]|uniref:Cell division protein CrgA n=1 Tax=Streptomonospora litoralis TaxID=2498135 RepID=A0A4P6PZR3_9ACTN|nr:cell division protein CrgA [Streptomonospora litoralis]QBI51894.1 Cell division protein CrgA [Streptomonospora litoralis]
MPKSRSDRKKKAVYTPPPSAARPKVSPRWVLPSLIAVMVVGVLWIAVYYIAGSMIPYMSDLGNWNLAIGFGGIILALILSTRWH